MQSKATTVEQYLAELPVERRAAIESVRTVVLNDLPKGYEEGMQYGMIGYYVPHSLYPAGYHCDPRQPLPFAGLASQKNHMVLYLMCCYGDPDEAKWFEQAWTKTGKKLDMGKSCVRFKKIEDVALEVVGQAVKRMPVRKYIAQYESALSKTSRGKARDSAKSPKKTAKKKTTAKKAAKKSPARKVAKTKRAARKGRSGS